MLCGPTLACPGLKRIWKILKVLWYLNLTFLILGYPPPQIIIVSLLVPQIIIVSLSCTPKSKILYKSASLECFFLFCVSPMSFSHTPRGSGCGVAHTVAHTTLAWEDLGSILHPSPGWHFRKLLSPFFQTTDLKTISFICNIVMSSWSNLIKSLCLQEYIDMSKKYQHSFKKNKKNISNNVKKLRASLSLQLSIFKFIENSAPLLELQGMGGHCSFRRILLRGVIGLW